MADSYFRHHVFFCCNRRDGGRACCEDHGASAARAHAKVRINQAGCLDRCDQGPVLVVYPDNVWYTYLDTEDVDEIIDRHLIGGEIVERLRI